MIFFGGVVCKNVYFLRYYFLLLFYFSFSRLLFLSMKELDDKWQLSIQHDPQLQSLAHLPLVSPLSHTPSMTFFKSASGAATRSFHQFRPAQRIIIFSSVQCPNHASLLLRTTTKISSKSHLLNVSTLAIPSWSDSPHICLIHLLSQLCSICSSLWVKAHDALHKSWWSLHMHHKFYHNISREWSCW